MENNLKDEVLLTALNKVEKTLAEILFVLSEIKKEISKKTEENNRELNKQGSGPVVLDSKKILLG
jgi:hypothetical protein